jgi:acetyl-CoA acetyltransferase
MAHDAVIVDVVRAASGKGKPGGALSGVHPVDLLATVLQELVGARLLTTLVTTLEQTGGRYGLQTMCEGGGMANATIIERL